MGESDNKGKWLSLKNILIILGLSIVISLAYELGKSIFGNDMTIMGVIESFVIVLIAQLLFHFCVNLSNKKKK